MKIEGKILVIFLLMFVVVLANVNALEEADNIKNAYRCLDDRIAETSSLSLEEATFAALTASKSDKVLRNIRDNKDFTYDCWPRGACRLKETAQIMLAKKTLGEDTRGIANWLVSQTGISHDLIWYLQITIENNIPSECNLLYDGSTKSVKIEKDMKITGDAGSCFSISSSGYRLKVSESCLDKEFSIACNESFKTNILYEKEEGATTFVSPLTHSAAAKALTKEKITAKCFKQGQSCDYEGSLWAASALYSTGNNTDMYIPYLSALSTSNEKFFPSAFLIDIVGESRSNEYSSRIVESKKAGGFWEMENTPYNKFYDTALAILSLEGLSSVELEPTKTFLFQSQTDKGCWNSNNIRDTAFLIYASGWLRAGTGGGDGGSIPIEDHNGTGDSAQDEIYDPSVLNACEQTSNYCVADRASCLDAGGNIVESGVCNTYAQACCTIDVKEKTCYENRGSICASDEKCTGSEVSASDGICCLDECVKEETDDTGSEDDSTTPLPETNSGGWGVWIIILIVLIISLVIMIIYRNKLKIWWFKRGGKGNASKTSPGGGFPPSYSSGIDRRFGTANRPILRPQTNGSKIIPSRKTGIKDKEMEDTLNKLKEMSK